MMQAPLRVGLIGAGGIAQAYIAAIQATAEVELCAVADVEPARAAAAAEAVDCPSVNSHFELLELDVCDAVVVCTPPATHPAVAIDCLSQGIPVLCEKPLAICSLDAIRMLDAAAAAETVFTMASKFRYSGDVVLAKDMILDGRIGEVVLFEVAFAARVDMKERWNSRRSISGGGVLMDNGTHAVDIIRYLAGPIVEVLACEGRRLQGLEVEDTAQLFVKTAKGAVGHVDLSWSLDKGQAHYLQVSGSEGIVRVGWGGSDLRTNGGCSEKFGAGYDKIDAFRNQLIDFAACVREKTPLRITPEDAISSVQVVEAAYRSMESGHWEPVHENAPCQ